MSLDWRGPFGANCIPRDSLIFENLCQPGVYLRVKKYDGGRIIAYVGQSVSLLSRFDQHLSAILALATPLRDASGTVVFSGDAGARMKAFGNLYHFVKLAAADVGRVQFFYAMCDDYFQTEHLNLAERILQSRIAERNTDVENVLSAPAGMPEDVPERWENDFSALPEASKDTLSSLLGDDVMTLDTPAANAS
ncbi:MAG: hypothetical protein VX700_00065 [Pseudomonadota bacterium]|nr:hypothetical protein [Pseudomonadota bacterium]